MRILKWLLAAAAAAAAAAYASDRYSTRRTAARFRAALARDGVTVHSIGSSIPDPGFRQDDIHGQADGVEVLFTAKTDRDGLKWTYTLTWTGGAVLGLDLADVRDALKRLPVVPRDAAP